MSTTDPQTDSPRSPWVPVACAGGVVVAVYLFGFNRNLLYLSLLFSVAVMLIPLLGRRGLIVLVAALGFLAVVPIGVRDLGPLYPAPRNRPGAQNLWVSPLPPDQTWTYSFALNGIGKYATAGGTPGFLFIDGRNLAGLLITVQGKTLSGSAFSSDKNGFDHLSIPLSVSDSGTLKISLRAASGATPKVFHGAEADGFDVYGDAVWLQFDHGGDRAVYHAMRTVDPGTP